MNQPNRIRIVLEADASSATRGLQQADAELRKLSARSKDFSNFRLDGFYDNVAKDFAKLDARAARSAQQIEQAFTRLGLRTRQAISAEIKQLGRDYQTLAKSGTMSARDLAAAQDKVIARVRQLTAEYRRANTEAAKGAAAARATSGRGFLSSAAQGLAMAVPGGAAGLIGAAVPVAGAAGAAFGGSALYDAGLQAERLRESFRAIYGGDAQAAGLELDRLRELANRTGQEFWSLAEAAKGYTAAARESGQADADRRKVIESVTVASAALRLSSDESTGILRAFMQMLSKGTVQAEELRNQVGERLPGAFELAAKAMKLDTEQLQKKLELGEVLAKDMLPALADSLMNRYGKAAEEAADSGQAAVNRMLTAWTDLKVALADAGFFDAITAGIHGLSGPIQGLATAIKEVTGNLSELEKQRLQRHRMAQDDDTWGFAAESNAFHRPGIEERATLEYQARDLLPEGAARDVIRQNQLLQNAAQWRREAEEQRRAFIAAEERRQKAGEKEIRDAIKRATKSDRKQALLAGFETEKERLQGRLDRDEISKDDFNRTLEIAKKELDATLKGIDDTLAATESRKRRDLFGIQEAAERSGASLQELQGELDAVRGRASGDQFAQRDADIGREAQRRRAELETQLRQAERQREDYRAKGYDTSAYEQVLADLRAQIALVDQLAQAERDLNALERERADRDFRAQYEQERAALTGIGKLESDIAAIRAQAERDAEQDALHTGEIRALAELRVVAAVREHQQELGTLGQQQARLAGDVERYYREQIRLLELKRQAASAAEKPLYDAQINRLRAQSPQGFNVGDLIEQGAQDHRFTLHNQLVEGFQNVIPGAIDASVDSLDTFFNRLDQGDSVGESFRAMLADMGEGFAKLGVDILKTVVKMQILKAVFGGLGMSFGGGSGGSIPAGAIAENSYFADLFHQGGVVGTRVPTRAVPAEMFRYAPRFHSGGPVLAPGERPAILKVGEEVLTADQRRSRGITINAPFTVNVNGGDNPRETGQVVGQAVSRELERLVDQRIAEAKRPGGMNRREVSL